MTTAGGDAQENNGMARGPQLPNRQKKKLAHCQTARTSQQKALPELVGRLAQLSVASRETLRTLCLQPPLGAAA
jgi:hypothetical protein